MLKKLIVIVLLATCLINTTTSAANSVFTLEEEFRGKSESHGVFYEHTDIQYKYLVNNYFDVFTDYRFIMQKKSTWNDQSMFIEGFNIKYPEQSWGKVNLRTRLEIGLNKSPTSDTYYLNVFPKYNTPWKFTKFKINQFIADESFYDTFNSGDFVKNRVYVGVDWEFTPHIKGGTWYYKEDARSSIGNSWTHANVAVAQIKFDF